MASPYAQGGPSGGSVYAQSGTSGGSVYAGVGSTAAPKPKGGGFLGALEHVGHVLGQKADLAGRDIAAIPAGTVDFVNKSVVQPYKDVVTTGHVSKKTNANIDKEINQQSNQVEQTLSHPLRDPFATALTLSPLAHGLGRVGTGAVEASKAAAAGEDLRGVAKAALTKPEDIPRNLRVGDQGKQVSLIPSKNAAVRAAQAGYDRVIQKALDKEAAGPVGRVTGRVAAHAMKRVGGALGEEGRIQQKMRAVPASMLDKTAGKLSKLPGARRAEQAALELTSMQVTPEEAAAYHYKQAAADVNPKQNVGVARLYERVGHRDLVHLDESKPAGQKVFVNLAHDALAKADAALARVQERGDRILAEKNVRPPEALQARVDAQGRMIAGAKYEKPTPGKQGVPSPALLKAQARADRLGAQVEQAELRQPGENLIPRHMGGKGDTPQVAALRVVHQNALEEVQRLQNAAAARVKPTGIVGGGQARPGRGFLSARTSEKKLSKAEASASRGPVVGAAKSPLDSKTFTGRSRELGLIPKHVTASASRHFRTIVKFVNTDAQRRAALDTGSAVRRSARDVLVREPDVAPEKLSAQIQQALGREHPNVDTPDELATQEGLQAAHQMFLQHLIPGLADKFAGEREMRPGTTAEEAAAALHLDAPKGYRWVDRNALGDLASTPAGPRGKIARSTDSVNSAITALTVYFKVGHVGTRVLTNATTNIIQGSARPDHIARSYKMWDALAPEERARALAASGQHGFASLPHEGDNLVSVAAGKGAQWWAKHADAMFRFNSLAYELRKIGVTKPEQFTKALDGLESGGQGLPAHEWSKLSAAGRRADREAISYDRLNDFEKRFITRGVWFYPWIKGSTLFTVRTALEHPFKAAALTQAGVQGRKDQLAALGPTPSYEAGLIPLGSGSNPVVTDLSTFSPFATAGQVIEAPAQPGALAGFLNPAVGSAGQFLYGLNQYGGPSKTPYTDALLALGSATPEQQLAEAYGARGQDQSGRMFKKTPLSTLERYLVGPAMPRRVNKSALAKAAARERSGQR